MPARIIIGASDIDMGFLGNADRIPRQADTQGRCLSDTTQYNHSK